MFQTPVRNKHLSNVVNIPPSPLMKTLGYGTGVAVYEMKRSPITGKIFSPWAVKKVTTKSEDSEINQRLIVEADILRKLKHPNIVGFRAFVKNKDGTGCLAMEECTESLGTLIEERFDEAMGPFPSKNILKVALDMINALQYLHCDALIMHGDIKSYNVLVNGDFYICKLCDFGVSLKINKDGIVDDENAEYNGSACWSPPEVLLPSTPITVKADIYAFGLVLWEMLALQVPPPYVSEVDNSIILLDSSCESVDLSDNELGACRVNGRPPLPNCNLDVDYNYVLELFYCCTEENPALRPPIQDLLAIITEIMKCIDAENVC